MHDKPTPRANCWYDESAVQVNIRIPLRLNIHLNPKTINELHADYGVGMLWSVNPFSFGRYRLIAKMPKGNFLWLAFWLYSFTPHRPEEIDIIEVYSEDTTYKVMGGMCKKDFRGWNIRSCLHTGTSDVKLKSIPAIYPVLEDFNSDPSSEYVTYEFVWTKTYMSFIINGVVVRMILDRDILDHFAKHNQMYLVINTHIDGRFYKQFSLNGVTPFDILDLNYQPL